MQPQVAWDPSSRLAECCVMLLKLLVIFNHSSNVFVLNSGSIRGLCICALQPQDSGTTSIENRHNKTDNSRFNKNTQVANNGELTKGINCFKILEYNVLVPTTFTSSKRFLIWKHLLAFKAFLLSYGSPSKVHIQLTVVSFNVTCPSHSSDSNVIKATSKMVSKMRLHF